MLHVKNLFYWRMIYRIGGVETFLWEIARKYGETHDIAVVYREGDPAQVARLTELVRTIKWKPGLQIHAERAFFGYQPDMDGITADEYFQVIHADYKAMGLGYEPPPEPHRFIAVSQNSRQSFAEISGQDVELSYNPIDAKGTPKLLRLISCTRMTPEKGVDRMKLFAKALDDARIPFTWEIFTTGSSARFDSPNVFLRPSRLDVRPHIAAADYLVQLSDTEGYPYSVLEALCLGTPVIVTDFPSARELQLVDRVNSFILPLDMSELPLKEIHKGLKKFKYIPHSDRWDEFLIPGPGTWLEERGAPARIRTVMRYFDILLDRQMEVGDEQVATAERAEYLVDLNFAEYV